MLIFDVYWKYLKNGKVASRNYTKVIAANVGEAEMAFRQIHPDGSNFRYEIEHTRPTTL